MEVLQSAWSRYLLEAELFNVLDKSATRKLCLISFTIENEPTWLWFELVRVNVIGCTGSEPLPDVLSTGCCVKKGRWFWDNHLSQKVKLDDLNKCISLNSKPSTPAHQKMLWYPFAEEMHCTKSNHFCWVEKRIKIIGIHILCVMFSWSCGVM